jgi:hypothetical protein
MAVQSLMMWLLSSGAKSHKQQVGLILWSIMDLCMGYLMKLCFMRFRIRMPVSLRVLRRRSRDLEGSGDGKKILVCLHCFWSSLVSVMYCIYTVYHTYEYYTGIKRELRDERVHELTHNLIDILFHGVINLTSSVVY